MIGGFRTIVAEEGAGALATGLGATAAGYFVQGWFKFGGVEYFKISAVKALGEQSAWDNKTSIYIGAAAGAEFVADLFLCPLEAVRIRSVSDPEFCSGLMDGFAKMAAQEGIGGFYAGLLPILAKQIPYTCAKFVVQGSVADAAYASLGKTPSELSSSTNLGISLGSGVIAGVASAIISHPADTLLSKVNKKGAGGTGTMMQRLSNIAKEIGFYKLCTVGLIPRCVMIGTLTAGQCKCQGIGGNLCTTMLLIHGLIVAFFSSPNLQSVSSTRSWEPWVPPSTTSTTPVVIRRDKQEEKSLVISHDVRHDRFIIRFGIFSNTLRLVTEWRSQSLK